MPARPVFHPALGRFFQSLRERRGWGQSEAAAIAGRRQLQGITRQVIIQVERGLTKNLNPVILRSIAALYEASYEDLVQRFVVAQFGVDIRRARRKPGSQAPALTEAQRVESVQELLMATLFPPDDPTRGTPLGKEVKRMREQAARCAALIWGSLDDARTIRAFRRALPGYIEQWRTAHPSGSRAAGRRR